MRTRTCPTRRPAAFSLIEMLTVISILAILAVLLTPVLSRMRSQALVVQDANNLRQVGVGLLAYTQDNNNVLPGPLYVNQCTHYQVGSFEGHLSLLIARYVGAPEPDDTLRELDIMVDPAWKNIASDTTSKNVTCYHIVQRAKPSATRPGFESSSTTIFGYPLSNANNSPLRLITIPPTVPWQEIPIVTNKNLSELDGLPSHRTRRNILYLDGHVETVPNSDTRFTAPY